MAIAALAPVIGAAVSGISSAIGGVLGANAESEERRKQRLFEGRQAALDRQSVAAQQGAQNQQNALAMLMQNYRQALA